MLKQGIIIALLILLYSCASHQHKDSLVIKNTNIVDVKSGEIIPHQNVWVSDGKIIQIETAGTNKNFDVANIVEGENKYLIPGLWDMHTHLAKGDIATQSILPMFIANGVTNIRDMSSDCRDCESDSVYSLNNIKHWNKQIMSQQLVGPRIRTTSGTVYNLASSKSEYLQDETASTEEFIKHLKNTGVTSIKIYDFITNVDFNELAKYAELENIDLVGHVPWAVKATEAAKSGMKSMEHLIGFIEECSSDENNLREELLSEAEKDKPHFLKLLNDYLTSFNKEKCIGVINTINKHRVWYVPTLIIYQERNWQNDPRIIYATQQEQDLWERLEQSERNVFSGQAGFDIPGYNELMFTLTKSLYESNSMLLAGTDSGHWGIFPGSLSEELSLLKASGLSNLDVLRTATLNPAIYYNESEKMGSIEEGKVADLVLLNSNPLDNIENTKDIAAVIAYGRLFTQQDIKLIKGKVIQFVASNNAKLQK